MLVCLAVLILLICLLCVLYACVTDMVYVVNVSCIVTILCSLHANLCCQSSRTEQLTSKHIKIWNLKGALNYTNRLHTESCNMQKKPLRYVQITLKFMATIHGKIVRGEEIYSIYRSKRVYMHCIDSIYAVSVL